MKIEQAIKDAVREVVDYPIEGVVFKDITTLLLRPELCKMIVESFYQSYQNKNIDAVVGIESRGFIFGALLANVLNVPFVPVRKEGKLPSRTLKERYALEYGEATVEIHEGAIKPSWRVLIHDDLLATGGTAEAAAKLVKRSGGEVVSFAFLIELTFLHGRKKLNDSFDGTEVLSLTTYD